MDNSARLHRDASGRLTANLERAYPLHVVDPRAVKHALEELFKATFDRLWKDPLGDAASLGFRSGGEAFELGWNHWLGLHVVSLNSSGDALLERMAEYFEEHLPAFRHARSNET